MFTVGMYVGETVFVAVMGTLADIYGIGALSVAVTVPLAVALALTLINMVLFRRYKQMQTEAIGQNTETK